MMNETVDQMSIAFQRLFESAPDLYLILAPDLTIITASNSYLRATLTKRIEIAGRGLFEVFPDNPNDKAADGVSNLRASLNSVLQNKVPHAMPVQKYDIRRPDGTFEIRYWSPLNTPVLDDCNEVTYIIHRVEDVTEQERVKSDMSKYLRRKDELETRVRKYINNLRASEDRFSKIFNFSPIAILITTMPEGRILYANRSFEKLFLFKKEDVVTKTLSELGIVEDTYRMNLTKEMLGDDGNSIELEIDLKNSLGETKNILSSFVKINIENRDCFLKAFVDITQRKKSENALRQTNHFLDTILENIPNMVFVKDATDLRFLRFNKAGENMLGYMRKDMIGKNDYDFFTKEQAEFFIAKDREVITQKELVNIEEEPIQTTNGERWLHTQKIPIIENGVPMYLVGISEDITEKKKQHDAILHLNKELEAFSYSVSHDLRAPLRAITGFAKILDEDYRKILDDEGRRVLATISSNAEKMGRLIDDLLSFSRMGRKPVVVRDVDMNELVKRAIREAYQPIADKALINVGSLHHAKCDPSLMGHVLTNLVSNALKYSSKEKQPVIDIQTELTANEVIFSIKDNGVGFDMRYVDKLFGVFQRLHTADEFEGTGVGLAIVHRIIHKHGGRVWAVGKVNEGATVYFSLPLNNINK